MDYRRKWILLSTGISDLRSRLLYCRRNNRLPQPSQRIQWPQLFDGKFSFCASATARNINASARWDFRKENNHKVYSKAVIEREGEK